MAPGLPVGPRQGAGWKLLFFRYRRFSGGDDGTAGPRLPCGQQCGNVRWVASRSGIDRGAGESASCGQRFSLGFAARKCFYLFAKRNVLRRKLCTAEFCRIREPSRIHDMVDQLGQFWRVAVLQRAADLPDFVAPDKVTQSVRVLFFRAEHKQQVQLPGGFQMKRASLFVLSLAMIAVFCLAPVMASAQTIPNWAPNTAYSIGA